MNRVLKQRFSQISRQNNYILTLRQDAPPRGEGPKANMTPARPESRPAPADRAFSVRAS